MTSNPEKERRSIDALIALFTESAKRTYLEEYRDSNFPPRESENKEAPSGKD